jgi:hypothetical protein
LSDVGAYIMKFVSAMEAFNRDDLQPVADLIDDHCQYYVSGNLVAGTRDDCVAALKEGRAGGWTRHNLLSIAGAGEFVVSVFRNDLRDGSSFIGAGVHRLGPDGRLVEVQGFGPPDVAIAGNS